MPSNHLILCHPLLPLSSLFSSIRIFSNEFAVCIRWQNCWELQLQHQSFQWIFRLISFRIDWFDFLEIQGTLKSLLQHHSSKASILWCSASFMVQLSHSFITTGKTIALTIWNFVGKVMSLFLNMLPKYVVAFFPRSKCLLISWLQSPSAMILEPPQNKIHHSFHFFPFYLLWSDVTRSHDLSFLRIIKDIRPRWML